MKPKSKDISMRELTYVNEYMRNGFQQQKAMMTIDPTLTAVEAANTSTKYMKLDRVKDYINKRIQAMENETRLTKKFIEDELMAILSDCKNADDRSHVLKTIDIMNKFAGHYNHKQQHEVKMEGIVINYQKPSE